MFKISDSISIENLSVVFFQDALKYLIGADKKDQMVIGKIGPFTRRQTCSDPLSISFCSDFCIT